MDRHIVDLPAHLIETIFKYLKYKELDTVRSVCSYFHEIGANRMSAGIEHVLDNLAHKMHILEKELHQSQQSLEDKITLNQTFTTLKLLRMHVYSLYVLRRHYLLPRNHFTPFGGILDNITHQLQQMKANNCLSWLHYCLSLQNIISRFNIYNSNMSENVVYPFGVHVIDILDVLTGINYDIKCLYNFENNSCNVFAYYYTENVKFLTYMPDINFIKDCQDRYLTAEERRSILKYLLALVNLYNGLHGKKEEYDREMQFASNKRPKCQNRHTESHSYRKVVHREFLSKATIMESYENQHNEQKALLGCNVQLICSMDSAPFKISKNCELLKRDLYLMDSKVALNNESSPVNYAVEIKLKFVLTHKMQELFYISIKDVDF